MATPSPGSPGAQLRWQFDLAWSLFDYHLQRLVPEDFLWAPGPLVWTMHRTPEGGWRPDWANPEPDPIPVPTIGWVSWHLGWWWSTALDHARGRTPRERTEIHWPGPGDPTIAWLRALHDDWCEVLDGADADDLAAPAAYPWPADAGLRRAHLYAWANVELTKNAGEIGQLRLLRAAAG
ncbi:DinB family protein [Streptomyces sp. DSM 44915]|uniref:DinB family protein n=1 Tax=Streptomyces chisholmiae TaxID=3075540 RepID=A0ABU2JN15_9ACTN|nr:DinB family protein [Streptomyces sp. DSM 44915]MDT0266367.1 DinB family protein [Streptomyces sp. DSM 44915]